MHLENDAQFSAKLSTENRISHDLHPCLEEGILDLWHVFVNQCWLGPTWGALKTQHIQLYNAFHWYRWCDDHEFFPKLWSGIQPLIEDSVGLQMTGQLICCLGSELSTSFISQVNSELAGMWAATEQPRAFCSLLQILNGEIKNHFLRHSS